jgi:hypothetical protein
MGSRVTPLGCPLFISLERQTMSHITTIQTEIRDLDALKEACAELGVQFIEGQTTYQWYGAHMGDYPLPPDINREQLGRCAHIIQVPGVQYEVGVVQKANGHWTLAYDFWGPGQGLLKKFGENCGKLVQLYGVHKAMREAKRHGYQVQRRQHQDGSIQITIGGYGS